MAGGTGRRLSDVRAHCWPQSVRSQDPGAVHVWLGSVSGSVQRLQPCGEDAPLLTLRPVHSPVSLGLLGARARRAAAACRAPGWRFSASSSHLASASTQVSGCAALMDWGMCVRRCTLARRRPPRPRRTRRPAAPGARRCRPRRPRCAGWAPPGSARRAACRPRPRGAARSRAGRTSTARCSRRLRACGPTTSWSAPRARWQRPAQSQGQRQGWDPGRPRGRCPRGAPAAGRGRCGATAAPATWPRPAGAPPAPAPTRRTRPARACSAGWAAPRRAASAPCSRGRGGWRTAWRSGRPSLAHSRRSPRTWGAWRARPRRGRRGQGQTLARTLTPARAARRRCRRAPRRAPRSPGGAAWCTAPSGGAPCWTCLGRRAARRPGRCRGPRGRRRRPLRCARRWAAPARPPRGSRGAAHRASGRQTVQ